MPAKTNWMGGSMGGAVQGKNAPVQKNVDITINDNVYTIYKNNKILLKFTPKSNIMKCICRNIVKSEDKPCQKCPTAATQVAQTTAL